MTDVNTKLKAKTVVSFDVYATALYPTGFRRITVTDPSVSAHTTTLYNFDAEAEHAKVIGSLPEGSPRNFDDYNYLVGKTLDGQYVVVGLPWIVPDSIVVETKGLGVDVYLPNVNTEEEVKRLRMALTSNGFTGFDIRARV